ncbi:hypothetical protein ES705_41216 [subsurface metagenome]
MWKKVVSLFLIVCILSTLIGCSGGNPVVPPPDEEEGIAGVFESDSSGNLQFYDPLINKEVKISIVDNNSKEPVPGIQIFIFNNGEKIWVYSNDPSGKYFPSFYCEEITKLKQEKELALIIILAVIACIGPTVVAIIMQINENAQFFPNEKGYDKVVKTGKLEDILSAMETNNWKLMQIGPEVLTKLGMESELYHQYAELFSGNDAEKWKEELLDQGLSEHDTYQYGYYQINNNFAEHYVDIVGGDSLANWVDHQNDMTIVYLIDILENQPPVISNLSANPPSVNVNQPTTITCIASDPDGDPLTYKWTVNAGSFEGSTSGPSVTWRAPSSTDIYIVVGCEVSDGKGGEDTETLNILVTESEETKIENTINGFIQAFNDKDWDKVKSYCVYGSVAYNEMNELEEAWNDGVILIEEFGGGSFYVDDINYVVDIGAININGEYAEAYIYLTSTFIFDNNIIEEDYEEGWLLLQRINNDWKLYDDSSETV